MNLKIAISSGKGGAGKTFLSTNLAWIINENIGKVNYLDCDVEEPNGHLFIKPDNLKEERITLLSPVGADENLCIKCGKCVDACTYNAIALIKEKVMIFKELCHVCGACEVVCPVDAIVTSEREIGKLIKGKKGEIDFVYALLKTAEGGMSPRLVKKVKENVKDGINIMDSPPGTACPVVETVKGVDLCVLVTDPTPFGINDLKLSVDMAREVGQEPVIVVNRAEYENSDLKDYCRKEDLLIIGEIPDKREIAEVYSRGDILVKELPEYREMFLNISEKIIELASEKRMPKKLPKMVREKTETLKKEDWSSKQGTAVDEVIIISGKGGTGKTSLTAGFAFLMEGKVVSDCDVDAADLHLILNPDIRERGDFSGGVEAEIDQDLCTGCGRCWEECRFSAIIKEKNNGKEKYVIDEIACEGCGVCELVCKYNAVKTKDRINGEWYISETRMGPMSHAKLGVAEENSGRLVTFVKDNEKILAEKNNLRKGLMDGAPGTGCPVIASLNGAKVAVIVTEPTVSGIHDMVRIMDVSEHFGVKSAVVINKFDINEENSKKIEDMCKSRGIDVIGRLPYDRKVTKAQMKGLSVIEYDPNCFISLKIKEVCERIKNMLNN